MRYETELGDGWYMYAASDTIVGAAWECWAVPFKSTAMHIDEEIDHWMEKRKEAQDKGEDVPELKLYQDFGWSRDSAESKVRIEFEHDVKGYRNAEQA